MAASNKTSAARALHLQRQAQALELRRAGMGYHAIAEKLGIGKSQAHRLVAAGLADARDQIASSSAELKAEELSRLDAMLQGLWPAARKGGVAAVDRVVKIIERRSKLLGLDAPSRSVLTGPDGGPVQQVTRIEIVAKVPSVDGNR